MKIDELIQELEQVKEEHGNLEVEMMAPERGGHCIKDFQPLESIVRIYPEKIS